MMAGLQVIDRHGKTSMCHDIDIFLMQAQGGSMLQMQQNYADSLVHSHQARSRPNPLAIDYT